MKHFGDIMFTETVKEEQVRHGSRDAYAKMTASPAPDALSEREAAFIAARDSFYMASVSETGWPYIQHRGGPVGFLKVFGPTTIGFGDYRGNKQFVSTGNLRSDDRVALFLMDYPNRARLKMLGRASWIDAVDAPERADAVAIEGQGRIERIFTIEIEAFDWNCPQFITPRFTEAEIQSALGDRMTDLQKENAALKARLAALEAG